MTPTVYRFLTSLASPFLPILLRRRAKAGKEDAARLKERFGHAGVDRPQGPLVWVHGASVGETQMLRPLIDRLLAADPKRHVLVTSGTTTSAELLARQLPPRAIHQYVPVDTPRAAARFMAYWRPDLAVLAESEIWPNLIWTACRSDAKLALVNARMSDKSLQGWAKRHRMAESIFPRFDLILAADRRTADGLAQVAMTDVPDIGSLKYDAPELVFDPVENSILWELIGDRNVWLAASTHEAEEAAFHAIRHALPDAFMIWLPRHPSRGPALAKATGFPLRSAGQKPGAANGYVMDTLGEMGLALAACDVCVMGGSFDPSLMGHNPLEAARADRPVLTGPHVASFSALYDAMQQADAVRVVTTQDAPAAIREGLSGALNDMADRAKDFAASQSGALDRTHQALEDLL